MNLPLSVQLQAQKGVATPVGVTYIHNNYDIVYSLALKGFEPAGPFCGLSLGFCPALDMLEFIKLARSSEG